ncbi:MAG: Holliday junction branch migration protein RuvA [Alphaproteobacteria bacterium]|nr:Holliday junction branch migration protein RuvA [Alphaproteobacteria bacterium]
MIGKLQGIIEHIGDGFVIVMVGGVGYKVYTPEFLTAGAGATLWIETIAREDSLRLFGFSSLAGLELFNRLTGVSGVGPKVALAILATLKPDVLMSAIATGDIKTISSAPGVGKKMAEKIIVELKGKAAPSDIGAAGGAAAPLHDLLSALESLGYRRADCAEMAQRLSRENLGADAGELVKLALKEIAK